MGTWPVLLSEVANSWWGTKAALPILYAAGVPNGWTATQWQEFIVTAAHYGGGPILVTAVSLYPFGSPSYSANEAVDGNCGVRTFHVSREYYF